MASLLRWTRLALPDGFEPYEAETPANESLTELKTVYLLGARRVQESGRVPALLRSDDGGATWREIALPEADALPWTIGQVTMAFATPECGMIGLHAPGFRRRGHAGSRTHPGPRRPC
jgi:hypothetical protein